MSMKKPTLDILDSIEPEYQKYQNITPEKVRLKEYTINFLLDKRTWESNYAFLSSLTFSWNELKYSDVVEKKVKINDIIPEKKGIYLFIIKPISLIHDLPKYIFYVGIAGATGKEGNLQKRLKNYFMPSELKRRTAIETLIFKYYDNIYVAFSPLEDIIDTSLEDIEKSLIGFFGTHILANKDDAPIDLKQQQKAFNI